MYSMISGIMPFYGNNNQEVINKVKIGAYDFSHDRFNTVSYNGKQLIKQLLTYDPSKRITAKTALVTFF